MSFDDAVSTLRAAAEPTRLRILRLVQDGEFSVTDLTAVLGQSQPRVSRHVKLLAEAGLITRLQEGSFVFVRAAPALQAFLAAAFALVDGTDPTFGRDRMRVRQLRERQAEEAQRYFDRNAERWDSIRSLHVPEKQVEAAILKSLDNRRFDLALDLGTGTGRMIELLAGRSSRVLGLDSNRAMLRYARHRIDTAGLSHCEVRLGTVYDLPLAEGCADLVVVHQVLHFLENPGAAITEAARVLKPSGMLLIVDFAPHDLEFLRTEHAFVRLGFARAEMDGWLAAAGLHPDGYVELSHDAQQPSLTVSLWRAIKSETQTQPLSSRQRVSA
jgi:ubiquinone/menaquinone biosynthesis C-methylase UbiE